MSARRRLLLAACAVPALLLTLDLARPPQAQLSARALLAGIHLYRSHLSAGVRATGVRCRFQPSCSRYALGAIAQDGALVGGLRATWRILRCGPWTAAGTVDPP